MSNLPNSFLHPVDLNGNPYPGAKLYTYVGGSVATNLATYSDRELTAANANPVVADANGRFGEIYLTPGSAYKLVLKTTAGVAIWTDDDVYSVRETKTDDKHSESPLDYGAIGDGAADESAEVQAAINATSGVVDLEGKTFRCDSSLTMESGKTLCNGVLDFSACAEDAYIWVQGTSGDADLLTGNVVRGGQALALTAGTGVSAGDWLHLYSTDAWSAGTTIRELIQCDSIAGLAVTLAEPLEYSYNVASGAAIKKLTTCENVRFRDLTVISSKVAAGTGVSVLLEIAEKVIFDNCKFLGIKQSGIKTVKAIDVVVRGCTFDEDGGAGYGVEITDGSRDVRVEGCTMLRMRHGVTIATVSRYVRITDCDMVSVDCGISFSLSHHVVARGNFIICTGTGATAILGSGIHCTSDEFVIDNNDIKNPGTNGIYAYRSVTFDAGDQMHTGIITNNRIFEADDDGIYARNYDTVSIRGNHITTGSATSNGVYVYNTNCEIADNIFAAYTDSTAIAVVYGANVSIVNNTIKDGTFAHAIYITTAAVLSEYGLRIVGNRIYRPTTDCIYIAGPTTGGLYDVLISGNVCDCDATPCVDLLNKIKRCIISNNIFNGNDADAVIALAGDAAAAIDEVIVSGNIANNGTYLIGEATDANNTNVLAQGNIAISMATATFQGTIDNELAADDHNAT